ncbi:ABC-type multidrug transport system, ATPase and permease component [Oribacterium sp. KHPX15]|uniref:ABC transporter ATP-binding protein n=1 Tax=Oribacterium sp. KHPX15 TaxID=1855342 RepID=UPI00089B009F|nr:ABC transporter ATP-binding protein [Oribacterium sp. KHPX15]SEA52410.1 ABC-type multidrug transport system, ATPase and permease component [Oribacterium sp. KHPX15]
MKRLLSYINDYKVKAILAPLFKCLEACFDLLVPMVISSMIDKGIHNDDLGYVFKMGGLLLLLAAIGLTCSFTAQFFAAKVAIHTGKGLRNDLFRHINSLSYKDIDILGTSTLITRMTSDINAVESGVNMALRLFMRSPFIVFGAMILAFTINVKAGIIFTITIAVLFAVVFGIILTTAPMYKNNQTQLDKIMKTTRENLLGVRVVRAFNRQASEIEQFKRENDRLTEMQVNVGRISALLNPVTYVIINLAVVYLIYRGANFVDKGSLTQGQLVALVNYMSQILVELIKLANLVIQITRAMASMNRIDGVFSIKPSVQGHAGVSAGSVSNGIFAKGADSSSSEAPVSAGISKEQAASDIIKGAQTGSSLGEGNKSASPKVSFRDVSFAYTEGADPALSGITFDVMPGETVGVIGGTGAGKSTLINLIPRFYDVTGGEIDIEGKPVKEYGLSELRKKIGVVPQRSVLFRGTLRENMQWGKEDATDEEIYAALKTAQAYDFVEQKGEGLELKVEQEGRNFSGGQKQRLAIARAVVRKPEILILDDSASALDFATDVALRKAIKRDTENMTVFIISQRVSTVRNSDKIVVLDDGNVAGIGTHDELFNSCEVYKEICLSQLNKDEAGKPAGNTQNPSAETERSSADSNDGSVEASKAEALAENGKEAE